MQALIPTKDARLHAVIAFGIAAVMVIPCGPLAAWAFPTVAFYAREMANAEARDESLKTSAGRFMPWRWPVGNLREFLHPAIAAAVPALVTAFLT